MPEKYWMIGSSAAPIIPTIRLQIKNKIQLLRTISKSPVGVNAIVAYSTDGKPLTLHSYNKALEKAEQNLVKGKVTDSKTLKQEVKSWRK